MCWSGGEENPSAGSERTRTIERKKKKEEDLKKKK